MKRFLNTKCEPIVIPVTVTEISLDRQGKFDMDTLSRIALLNPLRNPFVVSASCCSSNYDNELGPSTSMGQNLRERDGIVHGRRIAFAATDEVPFGSTKYFVLCGFGGALSCGLTHAAIVPLDLVKCRMQVDAAKYPGIMKGFAVSLKEGGMRGLCLGWAPTLIGYSLQGFGKFGFYEYFKVLYANLLGPEMTYNYTSGVYLAASASAEFIADTFLAPWETVKVRMQTKPGFATTLREAWPKIQKTEGTGAFYASLVPLWMRQIPYTMMKFSTFEKTVILLYQHVVPKPREQMTKGEQLIVTFAAGYIAGVFCAIVSHPADTLVSKMSQNKEASAGDIYRQIGMAGLWKGLMPRIVMIGTLTALQWFIYDAYKVTFHLPRPPPPQKPSTMK